MKVAISRVQEAIDDTVLHTSNHKGLIRRTLVYESLIYVYGSTQVKREERSLTCYA